MKLRGSLVQRLINLFEGFRGTDSSMDNTKPSPTSAKPKCKKQSREPELSLLHASVFLIPTLQMLFEIVGFRPRQQSLVDMAELCNRLLDLANVVHQPTTVPRSMDHATPCPCMNELARLHHLQDVLDNVNLRPRKTRHRCRKVLPSDEQEDIETRDPPTWPKRNRSRSHRRRSADASKRDTPQKELPFFGPPTLAEAAVLESLDNSESTAIETCLNFETASEGFEAFDVLVKAEVEEVKSVVSEPAERVLPPTPTVPSFPAMRETTKSEEKTKVSRLKRKIPPKTTTSVGLVGSTDRAFVLARKKFLQKRRTKKEIRRARELFNTSLNPSIFSQFCASKGPARVTERIEWKADSRDPAEKKRPASPDIDTWSTLAARDAMLENKFFGTETALAPVRKVRPKLTGGDASANTKKFLSRRQASMDLMPCHKFIPCHYSSELSVNSIGHKGSVPVITKKDACIGGAVKMTDAATQTICFDTYDDRCRRKECRSKSEGGSEKQTMRESARHATRRFLDFLNDQASCVGGCKQRKHYKQETHEFRQFLLSRFLLHNSGQNSEGNIEAASVMYDTLL